MGVASSWPCAERPTTPQRASWGRPRTGSSAGVDGARPRRRLPSGGHVPKRIPGAGAKREVPAIENTRKESQGSHGRILTGWTSVR